MGSVVPDKVDRSEYDAYAALIEEKFRRFEEKIDAKFAKSEADTDKKISEATKQTVIWTVGLITAITGGWTALIVALLRK